MSLITEDLSVWEIGLRWAGHDPQRLWIRIPLEAKDNFRTLMDAILKGDIACLTIDLEKRHYERWEKQFSVYHWIDDIYDCIYGRHFNRKMLRWAQIERFDFKLWCERMNAPLPEFWFPSGWNLEYELPEGHIPPGHYYVRKDWTSEDWAAWKQEQEAMNAQSSQQPESPSSPSPNKMDDASEKMRPNQEARIACQQIAKAIWKEQPDRTIASVVKDELIQKYGGGSFYEDATVREWVKVVAPPHVRNRRGAPRKNGGENE